MQKRVLLIGDQDEETLFFLKSLASVYLLELVNDEDAALMKLTTWYRQISAVLIRMPFFSENNFRLVREMAKNPQICPIPVICIGNILGSEFSHIQEENIAFENGANDYLRAPFQISNLMLRIRNLITYREQVSFSCTAVNRDVIKAFDKKNSNGTFWNPNSLDTLMLKTYIGAACVLEFMDGRLSIIRANSRFSEELLGYSSKMEDEFTKKLNYYLEKTDMELLYSAIRQATESGERTDCQLNIKDLPYIGALIHISLSLTILDQVNNRQLFFCSLRNDTALYEEKQREKEKERRFELLNERLGNSEVFLQVNVTKRLVEAYRTKNFDRTVKNVNLSEADYEKIISEEIYRKDLSTVERILSYPALEKYYAKGETKLSVEYRRKMPDGRFFWFAATAVMIKDSGSSNLIAYIYCHDITKKMRGKIAKNQIVDKDVDDITVVNLSTKVAQIIKSRKNEDVKKGEFSYQTVTDHYISQSVAEEDKKRCQELFSLPNMLATVKAKGSSDFSFWMVDQKGRSIRKNARVTFLDSTHEDLLIVGRNITELFEKERKQQLLLQNNAEIANAANLAKTKFLARMSHDMRTPLNSILGLTELAKTEKDFEKRTEYIGSIETASGYLLELINDTLDLSKIESGKMELKEEPFSLEEFIHQITTVISPLMEAKRIHFILNLRTDVNSILVDKLRFLQVFFNLLSNAAKYTEEGGTVRFSSEEIPSKNGKYGMRFCIQDNGIGMSREFQQVLFEPFTQEGQKQSIEQKGTGLGMAIVKKIIDLTGGTIAVQSELGKGSLFLVDLYAYNLTHPKPLEEKKYDEKILEGIHVLLADDTEINLIIASRILEEKGCIVSTAHNGKEALQLFEESVPGYYQLILTDVRMAVMDGLEETRRIRALKRSDAATIPIIGATADAYTEEQDITQTSGMNTCIVKPFRKEELFHKMISLLKTER